ncbi:VOC family protein [Marinilactibacillus sp. XAAS-LB27]|uniref:VOC family protein n=1 Tax=Marinilactibacillus sp. XAAS-LB27 TaxID=3114538 RepID=UPI002E17C90F|nr:VOC family protein [Marinilactibacillus sp. XAAS-LB27]
MNWNSFYPVLMTDKIAASRDFYTKYFNYSISFEADWYVSLVNSKTGDELALLDSEHETIPEKFRKPVQGLLLNIEVDDVDSIYQKLVVENHLPIHLSLRDEAFGQRHFMISDPNNILIDVIEVIPMDETYIENYKEDTREEG